MTDLKPQIDAALAALSNLFDAYSAALNTGNTQPPPVITGSSYPATDGQIVWDGGCEQGDTSQYYSINAGNSGGVEWGNSSVHIVQDPLRWGNYTIKMELDTGVPGVQYLQGSERLECKLSTAQTGGYAGQEWYYSFSLYLPSNPNASTGYDWWTTLTEWEDDRMHGSPPLQLCIRPVSGGGFPQPYLSLVNIINDQNGTTFLTQDHPLLPIPYDTWQDWTFHIKWDQDPGTGFCEAWMNGKQLLPKTTMQTLDPGATGVHQAYELYRAPHQGSLIAYLAGARRHTAFTPYTR